MNLKMISSNIRYENTNDGVHSWKNRKPLIQNIITEFSPDILATQEGLQSQIQSLAEGIPLKLVSDHRSWISERMYPCLYVKEENIDINDSGDIWLSETPHISGSISFKSSFPRLCTWSRISHKKNKQQYLIINTHLDHVLEETRVQQIQVLIHEIQNINKMNLPLILMGDFNDSPKSLVQKKIFETLNLKDPWLEENLPEETSHHSFLGEKATGDRIDWILVPKTFSIKEIKFEKKCFNNIYPSDHYPLLATLIPN